MSRSPIYSHFSETINGAASIRAFGVCERFQSESQSLVDQNNVFFYALISASRYNVFFFKYDFFVLLL